MIIHGLNKHLYMAPDDGDGSDGGGGSPPPPPPAEETISKKEADAQAAAQRRKHERAQKEWQKKLDDQASELEALKAKASPPPPPPPPPPRRNGDQSGSTTDGKLEIMEERFTRQLAEQKNQIEAAQLAATEERDKRLQLERQQLIDKALGEAGVIPKHMIQARRFFDPQVIWDALEECWMFKTNSGNIVSISEGVSFELPDNLKTTKMRGGSGTTGGIPNQKKVAQTQLEAARKKKADLSAEMKKIGAKNHLLAKFTRAKNEVIRLENELTVRN